MSLRGTTVRIIVSEPAELTTENMFGTILNDRGGNKLIVKLTHPTTANNVTGDLIELRPINEKDTFRSLEQYYSANIKGGFVQESSSEIDFIIIGTVTID